MRLINIESAGTFITQPRAAGSRRQWSVSNRAKNSR